MRWPRKPKMSPRMAETNPDSPDHRIQGQDAEKNITEL